MGARIFSQFGDEPHGITCQEIFLRIIEVCLSSMSPSRAAAELYPLIEQVCRLVFILWNKEFHGGGPLAGTRSMFFEPPGPWQHNRIPDWPLFQVDYKRLELEIPEPD